MATIASLVVDIGADTSKLLQGSKKAERLLGKIGSNVTKLGSSLTSTLTPALLGAGAASVAAAVTIDNAMKTIAGGTGAAGDALLALGDDFRVVLGEVPQSADVVATALADMNTATGATGVELQGLVRGVLDASRALGETEVPALAFGRAMTQFELSAVEGKVALDAFLVTSQNTGIGLNDLVNKTNTYGGVLKNAGFTMIETAGFFGQLSTAGIEVSRVMPGLNRSFRNWAAEGLNSRDMLEQTVAQMVAAKTESEALNIATDAFGAEGAQRMTTAVRAGVLQLDQLTAGLLDSEGAVASAGEATLTFADKFATLKNSVVLALEPIGVQLIGAIEQMMPLMLGAVGVVASLAAFFADLPEPIQVFVLGLAGIAAAVGPVLLVIGPLIPMLGTMLTAIGGLPAVLSVAGAALTVLTGPIGLVVAGVAALIAIWVKWGDDIKRIVTNTITAVGDWLLGRFGGIVDAIGEKVAAITGFFSDMWHAVVGGSFVPDTVTQIGVEFDKLDDLMVNKVRGQVATTTALLGSVVSAAGAAAEAVGSALGGPATTAGEGEFKGTIEELLEALGGGSRVRGETAAQAAARLEHLNQVRARGHGPRNPANARVDLPSRHTVVNIDARGALLGDPASQARLARLVSDALAGQARGQGFRVVTV